jgi:hypothetical protein
MTGDGVRAGCTTSDVNMIGALAALNGDSHLEFQGTTADKAKPGFGPCSSVLVRNGSSTKPK